MQLESGKIKSAARNTISGLAWVFGLLLAGSDGNFMPWTNIAGILLFGSAGWYMAAGKARAARESRRRPRNRRQKSLGASAGIIRGNRPAHGTCLLGHSS